MRTLVQCVVQTARHPPESLKRARWQQNRHPHRTEFATSTHVSGWQDKDVKKWKPQQRCLHWPPRTEEATKDDATTKPAPKRRGEVWARLEDHSHHMFLA